MISPLYPGRYRADVTDDFVLFRIGMRFNGLRGLVPALRTFARMPALLREQRTQPELGMLWQSAALAWPGVELTQIWRSFEDLERYATSPACEHAGAWRWFNTLGRSGRDTGIWHETFRVAPGTFESLYANMPRYGVAAAFDHVAVTPSTARARARMAAAAPSER